MIDFSHNHLKNDIDALLKHIATAVAAPDAESRKNALFRAGLRLMRLEKEIARMGDVIGQLERAMSCPSCGHMQTPEFVAGDWRLPEHYFDSDGICPLSNLSLDSIDSITGFKSEE
jgi:hypothetical protein